MRPVVFTIYSIVSLLILRTLISDNKVFYIYAAIVFGTFLIELAIRFDLVGSGGYGLGTFGQLVRIGLFMLFISYLIRLLATAKKITADLLKCGICVYFLLGFCWALIYGLVYWIDPPSFSQGLHKAFNFIYFSFTTLTTLGYGDITPVGSFAMMLTSLEAITGQLFVAILIARLVSLRIVQRD